MKIIIVEDDPMILEIYEKKFSQSGFEVMTADSGDAALVVLQKEKADIMILDLLMPKTSGYDVIEKTRSGTGVNQNIKIFVTSNLSQEEDQNKAMKLGADGFIVKSNFSPSEIVEEVKRLAGESKQQ